MTKPREKTREELTAEIEENKKKIRQYENRAKIIKQKLSLEERKARNHRLCLSCHLRCPFESGGAYRKAANGLCYEQFHWENKAGFGCGCRTD